ncbi:hypothetical protein RJZ56_007703 [Blastomyces dermatitidis]
MLPTSDLGLPQCPSPVYRRNKHSPWSMGLQSTDFSASRAMSMLGTLPPANLPLPQHRDSIYRDEVYEGTVHLPHRQRSGIQIDISRTLGFDFVEVHSDVKVVH